MRYLVDSLGHSAFILKFYITSENMTFPNVNTNSKTLGPFNYLAVLYFPFGLSPNILALIM